MNILKKIISWENEGALFTAVFIIVFFSRLPFLLPGYGIDPDAWGVAYASRMIALQGGEYFISRFPGYPFQEYVYSLLWQGGPLVMNGLTALFSGFAAAFLSLSVRQLGGQFPLLTGIVFASIPVIYINSTNSMDYLWAVCFILGSLYFLLNDQMLISGMFLGMAIGTRITSGAMLLPLGILWAMRNRKKRGLISFIAAASIVGGVCFLPVYLKFGGNFFRFTELQKFPLTIIIKTATVDVWGLGGTAALGLILLSFPFPSSNPSEKRPVYPAVWILTISLYLAMYIRLPHEPGYLIPTLPFLLILLSSVMGKRYFLLFSAAILLSSFLFGVSLDETNYKNKLSNLKVSVNISGRIYVYPFAGPIIENHFFRIRELERFNKVLQFGDTLQERSLLIVGWHMAKFIILAPSETPNPGNIVYSDFLTPNQIQPYRAEGYQIYYLPEMSDTSRDIFGVDFQTIGAISLDDATVLNTP